MVITDVLHRVQGAGFWFKLVDVAPALGPSALRLGTLRGSVIKQNGHHGRRPAGSFNLDLPPNQSQSLSAFFPRAINNHPRCPSRPV